MFRSRSFIIITHIIGWLLFISLPVFFLSHDGRSRRIISIVSSPTFWLFGVCYIVLFYFHTYWLIPRLFIRRRYLTYTAIVIALFGGIFLLKPFDMLISRVGRRGPPPRHAPHPGADPTRRMPPPPPGEPFAPPQGRPIRLDITSIFLFIMVVALSLAVESTRSLRSTEQRAMKAEADKANAQLSFLMAQINPHFLFNTLNNIYSLAISNDPHTAEAIMKLSSIMRYVTDEAGVEYGALENEVACIQDYIDLQRLRLGRKVQLEVAIEGELEGKRIAPLILMTFIENVFKHGVSNHHHSLITIQLVSAEDRIRFFCRNRIFQKNNSLERRGIGISNTRERLEHLYPNRYRLDIQQEDDYYTVNLELFG
ncbi:sensor histidine kinase [Telluribacter sp. SYSU D00476]|uniref:sensor histidine kinase n=1 Tax=Telluribacter sp. SYSU D00476 TaxID=2811430 RepID=UPI001FF11015|nr:sensor histidine kinase [Telluribacter sp. SYSU D00476]